MVAKSRRILTLARVARQPGVDAKRLGVGIWSRADEMVLLVVWRVAP